MYLTISFKYEWIAEDEIVLHFTINVLSNLTNNFS